MIDDEIIRTEQNYFLMIHETWLYEVKCGTNGLSLSNQSNPVEILLACLLSSVNLMSFTPVFLMNLSLCLINLP